MTRGGSVFISYSHDSELHKRRVLELADRLRASGIDCSVDAYESSPTLGWPSWILQQIEEARFVLIVCSEIYRRRFEAREASGQGKGAKWEGAIITRELYEAEAHNRKFIPILFSEQDQQHIPNLLRSATYYRVDKQRGYELLYRRLSDQPLVIRKPLGTLIAMPPANASPRLSVDAHSLDLNTPSSVAEPEHEEIVRLLRAAQGETSIARAASLLRQAATLAHTWKSATNTADAAALEARALAAIALDTNATRERADAWEQALRVLRSHWESHGPGGLIADVYSTLAVDCVQDALNAIDRRSRQKILRIAVQFLDRSRHELPRSLLCARKSAVLRYSARLSDTKSGAATLLEESLRAARAAVAAEASPQAVLELGMAEWAAAHIATDDLSFVAALNRAERCFLDGSLEHFEAALLAVPRFYRLVYRPLDSCEAFSRAQIESENRRQLLRESYVYGEAVIQLWYSGYPRAVIDGHCHEARRLLERALSGGYRNLRNVVALAFVTTFQEGPDAGSAVLSSATEDGDPDWQKAVVEAATAGPTNYMANRLILGADTSGPITRLGTFVWDFLSNRELAGCLYRYAVELDGTDAVALTNLARYVATTGERPALQDAMRWINLAKGFADRRFTWWRAVLADIESRYGAVRNAASAKRGAAKRAAAARRAVFSVPIRSFGEIAKAFETVRFTESKVRRETLLSALVLELANLSFGMWAPSQVSPSSSIEAAQLKHRAWRYVVRCRWPKISLDQDEVLHFLAQIPRGRDGLLLSMPGFTNAAIAAAPHRGRTALILMDGSDLADVVNGKVSFDELMTVKREHLAHSDMPLARVQLTQQPI